MGWKEWPYWLKGGLILVVLYILITLILIPFGVYIDVPPEAELEFFDIHYWMLPAGIVFIGIIDYFTNVSLESLLDINKILIFLLSSLIYFILGTILGMIYGFIKKNGWKRFFYFVGFGALGICVFFCLKLPIGLIMGRGLNLPNFRFDELYYLLGIILGIIFGKKFIRFNLTNPTPTKN